MRALYFLCLLLLASLSLIKTDEDDDDEKQVTEDKKSNAPVIQSSSSNIYFEEQFQEKSKWKGWIQSKAKKDDVEESLSKYDGEWAFELPETSVYADDYGLILKTKAKHHAISTKLTTSFDFTASPLIVQYEVKFQTNQECGGAYVKLLSDAATPIDLKQVTDKTPYTIMFGPDMCGVEHKYHFIVRYRNPKTGSYSEHQAKKTTEPLESYFTDKKTHLYTLVLSSDNSFKMYIDNKLINSGNLLEDMEPAIVPPKEIADETDRKPDDWDEEEKIVDSKATKPEDWNENAPRDIADPSATVPKNWLENQPLMVPDPDATQPEDWDDDIDGTWEAPSVDNPRCKAAAGCGKWTVPVIPNPAHKGKWSAPLIDNPNYQGIWKPRQIANPNYFDDPHPYRLTPIGALTLELWSMVDGIVFDNFLLTSDQSTAKKYADRLWSPKFALEEKATPPSPSSPTTASTPTSTESSESLIEKLTNAAKVQPWLWAVYALAGLLPLVLIGFCWSSDDSKKNNIDEAKQKTAKKTDSDHDDDDQVEQTEIDNEEEEEEEEPAPVVKTSRGKSTLETVEKPSSVSPSTRSRRRTRKE